MTRPLTVRPGPPLGGCLLPPGDKSITHRAFLFGLLAEGRTRVENPNPGEDCRATLRCAETLGAGVEREGASVVLVGTGGHLTAPRGPLDCGNSGTSLRLLAGVLAAQPFAATLTGDASLCRRPVDRVILPLRAMGASLSAREGDRLPPLVVRGGSLRPCAEEVFRERPTPSAQVASAVLLAGLSAPGRSTVFTRRGVRDHTVHLLRHFGVPVEYPPPREHEPFRRISLSGPARLAGCRVDVPGDFSAAAFFLAAAAARPGARVVAEHVNLNPTRVAFLDVLERMGAGVEVAVAAEPAGGEPVGTIAVTGPATLGPGDIPPESVPALVDEIPAWAVAASAASGISHLRGASELRLKESDRLHALAEGLGALGVRVEELPDGLDIHGGPLGGGTLGAHGDHRIAMAFALLGTRASAPVTVDDASSIATSYPDFVAAFGALGGRVEAGPPAGAGA